MEGGNYFKQSTTVLKHHRRSSSTLNNFNRSVNHGNIQFTPGEPMGQAISSTLAEDAQKQKRPITAQRNRQYTSKHKEHYDKLWSSS